MAWLMQKPAPFLQHFSCPVGKKPKTFLIPALTLRTQCNCDRPNLDDVERLSRGKPSKSKIGSRSVPHRLNADERKAYELAKKRGYLNRQIRTRDYPLLNTYRNYCDAVGWPCLRIDQGSNGAFDSVVVDLTTIRQEEREIKRLRSLIHQRLISEFGSHNCHQFGFDSDTEDVECNNSSTNVAVPNYQVARPISKRLSQMILECFKAHTDLIDTKKPIP